MNRTKVELRVGIFIFFAVAILAVFILKIGNLKSYSTGYEMKFIFHNVSGVKAGSPVRFSGVDVGEVANVTILEENIFDEQNKNTRVEVIARLQRSLLVPKNSKAFVNTLGLLGEKYIEIIPPAKYNAFLEPGGTLFGNDPVMMHDWVAEGEKVVKDLQELIHKLKEGEGTVGRLLNDDELYHELTGLIKDLRQAKGGTVGKLLYDDRLYQELEGLVVDLRKHPWKLFWKTKEKQATKK